MNIKAAQKIKYGGSAQVRVVPVLLVFNSVLFCSVLNMLFNSVSLLDNVALVIDELMSMEH